MDKFSNKILLTVIILLVVVAFIGYFYYQNTPTTKIAIPWQVEERDVSVFESYEGNTLTFVAHTEDKIIQNVNNDILFACYDKNSKSGDVEESSKTISFDQGVAKLKQMERGDQFVSALSTNDKKTYQLAKLIFINCP